MKKIKTVVAFLRYNALHIFGGRFVVFLGLALGLFFLVLIIGLLGRGGTPNSERLYNYLLAPGILLVFYPSVYGIQRPGPCSCVSMNCRLYSLRSNTLPKYVTPLPSSFGVNFPGLSTSRPKVNWLQSSLSR